MSVGVKIVEVDHELGKVVGVDSDGVVVDVHIRFAPISVVEVGDVVEGDLLNDDEDPDDFYISAYRMIPEVDHVWEFGAYHEYRKHQQPKEGAPKFKDFYEPADSVGEEYKGKRFIVLADVTQDELKDPKFGYKRNYHIEFEDGTQIVASEKEVEHL